MQSAATRLQDAVLPDALLGGARILDRVAAARVQQTVEAAAGALGQVAAVDEHDVEPAQRRVPSHSGARRATTDHQDLGAERDHRFSLPAWKGGGGRGTALSAVVPDQRCTLSRPSRTSG